jgi:hypothetical protein
LSKPHGERDDSTGMHSQVALGHGRNNHIIHMVIDDRVMADLVIVRLVDYGSLALDLQHLPMLQARWGRVLGDGRVLWLQRR